MCELIQELIDEEKEEWKAEGRKEGLEEGSEKTKIQIYSNLLNSGYSQERAQKVCGLSDKQIKHWQCKNG